MKRKLGIAMCVAALPLFAALTIGLDALLPHAGSMYQPAVWAAVLVFGAWVYKGVNLWFD